MQINSKVSGFFFHVASEFAIANGWDFEQDLNDFYTENTELAEKLTKSMYLELSNHKASISEWDCFQASKGVATESFQEFWNTYAKGLFHDAPDNAVVLQSMHSGSSDYLYVKDVKELVSGKIDLSNTEI